MKFCYFNEDFNEVCPKIPTGLTYNIYFTGPTHMYFALSFFIKNMINIMHYVENLGFLFHFNSEILIVSTQCYVNKAPQIHILDFLSLNALKK